MTVIPTTPTSPSSTTRKRRSLRIPSIQTNHDSQPSSPYRNGHAGTPSHSRHSSQSSMPQHSPITPRPTSSRFKRPSSSRLSIGSNISTGLASNAGLGNLADELEDAWNQDLDEQDSFPLQGLQEGDPDDTLRSPSDLHNMHELSIPNTPRSPTTRNSDMLQSPGKPPSPSKQWASMGTHRKTESLYDGSDYGPDSDDEAFDSIPPTLQRRIHDVEEITRISANADAMSESGGVIERTTSALKDNLGARFTIENSAQRLSTAYTSMATHRSHQHREITLPSSIYDLPEETIELLVAELDSLLATLPFLPSSPTSAASQNPLSSLQALANNTHELLSLLYSLTDTLTEHRQHLLTATRRLKSVRDLVEELTTEEELVETSIMLIQAGDWDRRCRERHASKAVGEVLEGFRRNWGIEYNDECWKPSVNSRREIQVQ
ncbi:hypothetical protein PMZ80_007158 [Knufia obscura]|uniref:Uncharacterized protein n=1 Tax=Knufia obscura TaxID=1635080 RepID=A0ABR0RJE1_9EURO|nr:hypothetical protein PMZ80_007158 [Knufia obscura]